jgi:hypothetical protein
LCGFVVLVSYIILLNFLYAHVQSLTVLLFTCLKIYRFLISFVITSQILNYTCFDIFTNSIVKYFAGAIFFPFLWSFSLTLRLSLSFWGFHHQVEKYKVFSSYRSLVRHLHIYNSILGVYISSNYFIFSHKQIIGLTDAHWSQFNTELLYLHVLEQVYEKFLRII